MDRMPLLFTYPLKPAPPLAVYEQLEDFRTSPGGKHWR